MTHFQSRAEKNRVSPEQKSESFHVSRGKGWSEPEWTAIPENRAPSRSYRITIDAEGGSIHTDDDAEDWSILTSDDAKGWFIQTDDNC